MLAAQMRNGFAEVGVRCQASRRKVATYGTRERPICDLCGQYGRFQIAEYSIAQLSAHFRGAYSLKNSLQPTDDCKEQNREPRANWLRVDQVSSQTCLARVANEVRGTS
jgi:hypothetical protein